nr:Chain D, purification tag [synthetic construct]
AALAAA